MGDRVILTATISDKDYDDSLLDGEVHGAENQCGDAATVCGLYFVDGLQFKHTRKPITCRQCNNVLNTRGVFKQRNGKWY